MFLLVLIFIVVPLVDSAGWRAADLHVASELTGASRVSDSDRAASMVAEGLDAAVTVLPLPEGSRTFAALRRWPTSIRSVPAVMARPICRR